MFERVRKIGCLSNGLLPTIHPGEAAMLLRDSFNDEWLPKLLRQPFFVDIHRNNALILMDEIG